MAHPPAVAWPEPPKPPRLVAPPGDERGAPAGGAPRPTDGVGDGAYEYDGRDHQYQRGQNRRWAYECDVDVVPACRPSLSSSSSNKPLPMQQATSRPDPIRPSVMLRVVRVMGAVSGVSR